VQRVHGKLREGRPKQHLVRLCARPPDESKIAHRNLILQPSYERKLLQAASRDSEAKPADTHQVPRRRPSVSFRHRHDVSTVDRAQVSVASVGRTCTLQEHYFMSKFLVCALRRLNPFAQVACGHSTSDQICFFFLD
jgi:hypothetical protein